MLASASCRSWRVISAVCPPSTENIRGPAEHLPCRRTRRTSRLEDATTCDRDRRAPTARGSARSGHGRPCPSGRRSAPGARTRRARPPAPRAPARWRAAGRTGRGGRRSRPRRRARPEVELVQQQRGHHLGRLRLEPALDLGQAVGAVALQPLGDRCGHAPTLDPSADEDGDQHLGGCERAVHADERLLVGEVGGGDDRGVVAAGDHARRRPAAARRARPRRTSRARSASSRVRTSARSPSTSRQVATHRVDRAPRAVEVAEPRLAAEQGHAVAQLQRRRRRRRATETSESTIPWSATTRSRTECGSASRICSASASTIASCWSHCVEATPNLCPVQSRSES